jgi:peptidoglycan hydrolase CwlO-like protein
MHAERKTPQQVNNQAKKDKIKNLGKANIEQLQDQLNTVEQEKQNLEAEIKTLNAQIEKQNQQKLIL